MDFKAYWQGLDAEAKKRLAGELQTSPAYLSQIANGHRRASPAMALGIERATQHRVLRGALRPDVYPPEPAAAVVNG